MKKIVLLITILFLFYCGVYGQRSTKENPVSFYETDVPDLLLNEKTYKVLPSLDMDKIKQEDEEDSEKGIPPRFGYRHKVNYDLDNSGEWIDLSDGGRIWRLSISCPDALSINLLYDQFWLPDGAKFFIYSSDSDHKHNIGAFTSVNNNVGDDGNIRGFATGLIYGNCITLEYYLPEGINSVGIISIAYVVQGYRYILHKDYGDAGCQKNINCPEGQDWQNEKNAVAMILINGNRECTGSLINTTANDNRPLFLTAEHCLWEMVGCNDVDYDAEWNPILDHWSFYWHYESPECISTYDPPYISTSGAVVVANSEPNWFTDFALLRLNDNDNPNNRPEITPYYLGWDVSGNANTSGVGIHHPQGDVKKISLTNQISNYPLSLASIIPFYASNMLWEVVWNIGMIDDGSSGSPLINSNHRVIGQAVVCFSHCPDFPHKPDYYSKLNVSWDHNLNIKRQLKHWLDPNQTGVTILDGCGSDFTNRTITINTTFNGCNNINVKNVTITNGATLTLKAVGNINIQQDVTINNNSKLILKADGEVNIGNDFEVELGSELEIK